jgi:hypothetical protein
MKPTFGKVTPGNCNLATRRDIDPAHSCWPST